MESSNAHVHSPSRVSSSLSLIGATFIRTNHCRAIPSVNFILPATVRQTCHFCLSPSLRIPSACPSFRAQSAGSSAQDQRRLRLFQRMANRKVYHLLTHRHTYPAYHVLTCSYPAASSGIYSFVSHPPSTQIPHLFNHAEVVPWRAQRKPFSNGNCACRSQLRTVKVPSPPRKTLTSGPWRYQKAGL